MHDYLTIGSTPCDEACAQVGSADYARNSAIESRAFIAQLEREFPIPDGVDAYFRRKGFPHDFGTYHEVCVIYDADDEASVKFAYDVENNTPQNWDDEARKYLDDNGYSLHHSDVDYSNDLEL